MNKKLMIAILAVFLAIASGTPSFTADTVVTDSIYCWGPSLGVTWAEIRS